MIPGTNFPKAEKEIKKVVNAALTTANAILKKEGRPQISEPIIKFSTRVSKVAGKAGERCRRPYLEFNLRIADANLDTYLADTPIHEVAHLMAFVYGCRTHGKVWAMCCRRLGIAPERYHKMEVPGFKSYTCPCGLHFSLSPAMHRQFQNGHKRHCRKCRGDLIPVK